MSTIYSLSYILAPIRRVMPDLDPLVIHESEVATGFGITVDELSGNDLSERGIGFGSQRLL